MIILIILIIIEVISTSFLPYTKGIFYSAMQSHHSQIWNSFIYMALAYSGVEICQAIKNYFVTKQALYRRRLFTLKCCHATNKLPSAAQRLQEDIKLFYQNSITCMMEYAISGSIVIILLVSNYKNPLLLLAALVYTIIALLINRTFTPQMKYAENSVQQAETEYRDSIRINNNFDSLPDALIKNHRANGIRLKYNLFSRVQNLILIYAPYIVLIPIYLLGKITLGEFMEVSTSFSLIVLNSTIIINMFPIWTVGLACQHRVNELTNSNPVLKLN